MNKLGLYNLIQFLVLIGLQLFVMPHLALFNTAFCFIYIGFILFLPIQIPSVLLLLLGFTAGITIDTFQDTAGIHAGACVLIAYLRPYMLRFLMPRDDYDAADTVNFKVMGFRWFLVYALILIFVHHTALFFLELGGLKLVGFTFLKILASTAYTFVVLVIVQLLFFPGRRAAR